jgi:hypothetical protein
MYHWGTGLAVTILFLNRKVVAVVPVTIIFSSLTQSSRRPNRYIITVCINENAVINDNYGRLQDIFLFKSPMGAQKEFFKIYG